ncbi:hypothetical protein GQ44DRAFT_775923 [Phaeosphaeriaceae sp. PMI808]|nr:hypothetical protein GQ44DRAFT_775923 [Phaeosphaeriaceae sp. PMI808]
MAFEDVTLGSVIVIGGCGLLGYHIVKHLLQEESSPTQVQITVFDISNQNNRYDNVTYINGDLANKSELAAAFDVARPNVIINVASPDTMAPDKSVFARCNIVGVQNIIELAQEKRIRALVHTSSSEVIQNSYYDLVFAAEDWLVLENPVNGSVYAKTKAVDEVLLTKAN